ncbi:MAG TPA: hypothetical protein VFH06_05025 [Candidatus Saccharimonadales bacterium]|nr:hypothetical protein [Candidatus Saccharimonadales bacterium]
MSEHLHNTIGKAKKVAGLFIAWNVIFFLAALIMRGAMIGDTADVVLVRGGIWVIGGLVLLYLLKQMSKGKRSSWVRLSVISVLAPLGAVAFIVFTPNLPLWFDIAQAGGAIMLAAIAFLVLDKQTRAHFPKVPRSS